MKIREVKGLVDKYGADTTLGEMLAKVQGNKIYVCPKCNGSGFTTVEYNCYPTNLPDSGFVYKPAYKDVECDLCKGDGYTDHEYKPTESKAEETNEEDKG